MDGIKFLLPVIDNLSILIPIDLKNDIIYQLKRSVKYWEDTILL